MKPYRFLCCIIILIASTYTAFAAEKDTAQKTINRKNYSVVVSAANFSIAGLTPFDRTIFFPLEMELANQYGFSIERRLDRFFWIAANYNAWNTDPYLTRVAKRAEANDDDNPFDRRFPPGQKNNDQIGALRARYGYKMMDLALCFKYDKLKHHTFLVGLGPSYTKGRNLILYDKYFDNYFNFLVYVNKRFEGHYWGMTLPVRYSFVFWKQRLMAGVQANFRKYFGLYSMQIDYGIHIGFNI